MKCLNELFDKVAGVEETTNVKRNTCIYRSTAYTLTFSKCISVHHLPLVTITVVTTTSTSTPMSASHNTNYLTIHILHHNHHHQNNKDNNGGKARYKRIINIFCDFTNNDQWWLLWWYGIKMIVFLYKITFMMNRWWIK